MTRALDYATGMLAACAILAGYHDLWWSACALCALAIGCAVGSWVRGDTCE